MKICSMIVAILLLMAAGVFAQAPETVVYQGRLANADGSPMTANDVDSVRFAFGTAPTGISILLWDTTVTDLSIDENGSFTVELGPLPGNVLTGSKRYLSLFVNEDGEMLPRQVVTSAPYAVKSANTPGMALKEHSNSFYTSSASEVVDSVTINAPTAGQVRVDVSGILVLASTSSSDYIRGWVSATSTGSGSQGFFYYRQAAAGTYYAPFNRSVVYDVSAGDNTFYFVGNSSSTAGAATHFYYINLIATFYANDFTVATSSANKDTMEINDPNVDPTSLGK